MARVRGAADPRGREGGRAVPADAPAGAATLRLARPPLRRRDHGAARRAATRLRAPPRAGAGAGAAEPASRLRPQARPPLRPDALAPPRPCRGVADPPAASVGGRRARRPQLRRAVERWPMTALEARLDGALGAHPESPTLGDFRAPPEVVAAETEALAAAERLLTPHRAVAASFGGRAVLLDWAMPTAGKPHPPGGPPRPFPPPAPRPHGGRRPP